MGSLKTKDKKYTNCLISEHFKQYDLDIKHSSNSLFSVRTFRNKVVKSFNKISKESGRANGFTAF